MEDISHLQGFASQDYSSALTLGGFFSISQQNGGSHIQGCGDSYQAVYGGRLLGAFNHTDVGTVKASAKCEFFLGETTLRAKKANLFCQCKA
jgi:hypothetical protein